MENKLPLHCYKLIQNEDSMSLKHYQINDWMMRQFYKVSYTFNGKEIGFSYKNEVIPESRLDRLVNDKVFTFSLSEDEVKELIKDILLKRKKKTEYKLNNDIKRLSMWERYMECGDGE